MANMHEKMLNPREMQIKIMRYHFVLSRMAITTNSDNSKYWQGCGEIGIFIHCWWGFKFAAATVKNSLTVPHMVKLTM